MRTGLYYGAEAHLVTSITMNGTAHLIVFGAPLALCAYVFGDLFLHAHAASFSVKGSTPTVTAYCSLRLSAGRLSVVPACDSAAHPCLPA